MTDHPVGEVRQGLDEHPDVTTTDDEYAVTSTPFESSIDVAADGAAVVVTVVVRVPMLDAVVVEESVAPVVQDGWFETFERRIEAVAGVTRTEPSPPIVSLDRDAERVEVTFVIRTDNADHAVSDAKALVDFVEGTYVQGVIPGYEYAEPVSGLVTRARDRSAAAER